MPEWLAGAFSDLPLVGLFLYSFLAATLLPGGSEVALFAYLGGTPQGFWPAVVLATAGNTLGGLTSYACGRLLPEGKRLPKLDAFRHSRHYARLRAYGSPVLFLAWVPLVGDLLCVAAGWLRLNWAASAAFMALGKFVRYWVVAQGALLV